VRSVGLGLSSADIPNWQEQNMGTITCLGTGTGSSNFLTGEASSAYLLKNSAAEPLLLDCGAGVGRVVMAENRGKLVRHIYLSHNHSDHTGDLPVYVALAKAQGIAPIALYGHSDVLDIVRTHRLHELKTEARAPDVSLNACADVIDIRECNLHLELLRTRHSYLCFGFLARDLISGNHVLGWTADGPFDVELYDYVAQAPIVIAHARPHPSADHACFAEIEKFAAAHTNTSFYLSHYGHEAAAPDAENLTLLSAGMTLELP